MFRLCADKLKNALKKNYRLTHFVKCSNNNDTITSQFPRFLIVVVMAVAYFVSLLLQVVCHPVHPIQPTHKIIYLIISSIIIWNSVASRAHTFASAMSSRRPNDFMLQRSNYTTLSRWHVNLLQ